jgi:hypothetical protein
MYEDSVMPFDKQRAEELVTRVNSFWPTMPPPAEPVVPDTSGLQEHVSVARYFANRSVTDVDPGDPKINNERPFDWLSKEAQVYYLGPYLTYIVRA